jgi:hypothetical protein
MAAPAILDPSQYPISIAGFTITGFADGSFIEISRDEDAFKDYSGGDGEAAGSATRTVRHGEDHPHADEQVERHPQRARQRR